MNSLQFLGNLTVVSVFQEIFVQQNYRTVNFYSNNSQNEVLNKIIRVASDSIKPIKHLNIDKIRMKRSSYDEPILNVVVVSNSGEVNYVLHRNCLYETTVIWAITQNDELNITVNPSLNMSSKVIVLTDSNLYVVNNLVKTTFNRMSLTNFSRALTKQFLTKFFSFESVKGINLKIFTEFNAPKSELTVIDNNYLMIGPDGIIAESLVKWLNVDPTFSSSVGRKHLNYQDWLKSSVLSPRLRYQFYHSAVLTKNVVTIFKDNFNDSLDLMLTSFPHQGRNFTERIHMTSEALYPHDIDCMSAIVPQQNLSNQFLRKVVNYADTKSVGFALILFIVLRIFLQKGSWHRSFSIPFDTIAVFLNQNRMTNDNQVKVAWDINLRAFSLLATTALSAIIFKCIIAGDSNEINSIDDLIQSNLTIYAPDYLRLQDVWLYLRPGLRSKIEFKSANDIQRSLVDERKFDFAYVYHKTRAEYLMMIANANVPSSSRRRVRLMKQQIHCGLASYRAAKNSPLTPYVNLFILRFLENGIYVKQLEWMQNLNQAVFQVKQNEPPKRENVVLTMQMVAGVFIVYAVGIAIAVFSFVIEMICGYVYPLVSKTIAEKSMNRMKII